MSKVIVQRSLTNEYVAQSGFTTCLKQAQVFANEAEAASTIANGQRFGFALVTVPAPVVSFAVVYIRKDDDSKLLAGAGKNTPDANKGQIDPSKRRFATFAEAKQHGSRFNTRKAKEGDKPGSAGHIGFFITETYDAVNSYVNWETGLTNSIK